MDRLNNFWKCTGSLKSAFYQNQRSEGIRGECMKTIGMFTLSTILFLSLLTMGHAETKPVGIVKSSENSVSIKREDKELTVEKGMAVLMGDEIRTGPDGSVGVVFIDDTVVSMGPKSRFVISELLFDPVGGKLSFVGKIIQGTIAFLSGQTARLAPDSVRLETPAGMVGVRGTHVLVKVEGK
jgi:hypothetical protein